MKSRIRSGVLAGLCAGVVFGLMMQFWLTAITERGVEVPLIEMVARLGGATQSWAGWLIHLFISAGVGGVFGLLHGRERETDRAEVVLGTLYGFSWYVAGGLILMPILLGKEPFAPLTSEWEYSVALGSLMGHLLFGVFLGGSFALLNNPRVKLVSVAPMGQKEVEKEKPRKAA